MQNLVRVSKIKGLPCKLPFEAATFYKWAHLGKYPEIFVKLSGGLFVDLDRLEQLIDASRPQPGNSLKHLTAHISRKRKKRPILNREASGDTGTNPEACQESQ